MYHEHTNNISLTQKQFIRIPVSDKLYKSRMLKNVKVSESVFNQIYMEMLNLFHTCIMFRFHRVAF